MEKFKLTVTDEIDSYGFVGTEKQTKLLLRSIAKLDGFNLGRKSIEQMIFFISQNTSTEIFIN